MVRYFLATEEQRDTNLYPFVLYHWTGMCDTVSCFLDQEEANNWIKDVNSFCNLAAEVNQYAETPCHRVEFFKIIVSTMCSFLKRWGGARAPQDIRFIVIDGYGIRFWLPTYIPTRHQLDRS